MLATSDMKDGRALLDSLIYSYRWYWALQLKEVISYNLPGLTCAITRTI